MAFYFLTEIQTIMDKSLGTNLHLWRFFTRAKQNHLHLFSPSPSPPPPPAMLDTCTRYFSRVSTLYCGGGGGEGEATHFKTEHSAFLKLMQLHKCPKEFCPPLQVSCDHVVLALGSHITFWSFLKQIKFAKPKAKNLIKQLFHSRLLDMRLVIANTYPTRAHGIIVKYTRAHELSLNYKTRAPRLALQN